MGFRLILGRDLLHLDVATAECPDHGQRQCDQSHVLQSKPHFVGHEIFNPTEFVTVENADHSQEEGDKAEQVVQEPLVNWLDPLGHFLGVQVAKSIHNCDQHENHRVETQPFVQIV